MKDTEGRLKGIRVRSPKGGRGKKKVPEIPVKDLATISILDEIQINTRGAATVLESSLPQGGDDELIIENVDETKTFTPFARPVRSVEVINGTQKTLNFRLKGSGANELVPGNPHRIQLDTLRINHKVANIDGITVFTDPGETISAITVRMAW